MNVRRLAAIDMYGTRGTTRRRRIILTEFILGAVVMVAIGGWILGHSPGIGDLTLGLWLTGAGLNYAPLAVHAITLSRPGALEAELANVDTTRELRRYSTRQLWIVIPLSLVALSAREAISLRRSRPGGARQLPGYDEEP
ncbi:hypothetical protein I6A60_30840 [Frankia sp. AgB1.9]|uniref:hypothetical protein n=1 Tax=Frankia sp. AgB1.9 TaxID=1836968 RepID=UPI0019348EAC|nr:hypothetical protein [Frankia sp. AgB1.9]MBL7552227.1 hypothetical protein [Frankia sp. AgB1.9]